MVLSTGFAVIFRAGELVDRILVGQLASPYAGGAEPQPELWNGASYRNWEYTVLMRGKNLGV
ncbi:hypothetical protein [Glutamicibacter uratoxydans]|uniref:hypothetical protein n=1 Tax=Glutamicibacter uratoxydans TaxID=43667 RepID=UPI003D6E7416